MRFVPRFTAVAIPADKSRALRFWPKMMRGIIAFALLAHALASFPMPDPSIPPVLVPLDKDVGCTINANQRGMVFRRAVPAALR